MFYILLSLLFVCHRNAMNKYQNLSSFWLNLLLIRITLNQRNRRNKFSSPRPII